MEQSENLSRFLTAQENVYQTALSEIKRGKKTGHWMWFIFPQIAGLGRSETSRYYALTGRNESQLYLNHPILGVRLLEISEALLSLRSSNAEKIFGSVDSLKLKSSMTLFALLKNTNPIFEHILQKFFDGRKDDITISILNEKH